MIYGSRGGTSFETIKYNTGSPDTGALWIVSSGTLTVDSNVPFVQNEKILILVQ
jgi:hypothetical protein